MPMFPYSIRGRLQLRARLREVRLRLYATIVECGCWKGGMSAALIEIGGFQRDYYFFDSFEGLPPRRPSMVVLRLLGRPTRPRRRITTIAQRALMTFAGQYVEPDVPNFHPRLQSSRRFSPFLRRHIAVLRLDADWYDSTMECLRKFWDFVLSDGLILIDDYYTWDGCSRALHAFLSELEGIRQAPSDHGAFITKLPTGLHPVWMTRG